MSRENSLKCGGWIACAFRCLLIESNHNSTHPGSTAHNLQTVETKQKQKEKRSRSSDLKYHGIYISLFPLLYLPFFLLCVPFPSGESLLSSFFFFSFCPPLFLDLQRHWIPKKDQTLGAQTKILNFLEFGL